MPKAKERRQPRSSKCRVSHCGHTRIDMEERSPDAESEELFDSGAVRKSSLGLLPFIPFSTGL